VTLSALLCYCTARGDDGGDWEELRDLSALRRPPPTLDEGLFFGRNQERPLVPQEGCLRVREASLNPLPPFSETHFFFGGFMMFCVGRDPRPLPNMSAMYNPTPIAHLVPTKNNGHPPCPTHHHTKVCDFFPLSAKSSR